MLWDLDNALDMAIAVAMDTRWGDLNTEELEETAKKLMQRCKKLPKPTKASSAFKALDKRCKEFQNSCPLITSLKTDCMKKRHWDELLEGAHARAPFKFGRRVGFSVSSWDPLCTEKRQKLYPELRSGDDFTMCPNKPVEERIYPGWGFGMCGGDVCERTGLVRWC